MTTFNAVAVKMPMRKSGMSWSTLIIAISPTKDVYRKTLPFGSQTCDFDSIVKRMKIRVMMRFITL
jgi:hypothetical protein